eukprot:3609816-Rhodomonas_salina.2
MEKRRMVGRDDKRRERTACQDEAQHAHNHPAAHLISPIKTLVDQHSCSKRRELASHLNVRVVHDRVGHDVVRVMRALPPARRDPRQQRANHDPDQDVRLHTNSASARVNIMSWVVNTMSLARKMVLCPVTSTTRDAEPACGHGTHAWHEHGAAPACPQATLSSSSAVHPLPAQRLLV